LAAVGGSIEIVCENSFARLVSLLFNSPFSGASGFWYSAKPSFVKTVAFGFYDKKVVEEVGCFDEDMIKGQDFELNLRLSKYGYKLYYDPDIKSYYYARNNFKGFLKQTFDNGAAKGLCLRKGYFNVLWFIPLIFILYQLLLFYSLFVQGLLLKALLIPFVFYWIINILVSSWILRKKRVLLLLPIMFWIFHNIIGFGFLAGIVLGKKVFRSLIFIRTWVKRARGFLQLLG